MKIAVVILALVASVLASPTHVVDVERSVTAFDWSKIEPLDVFIEPIGSIPLEDAPEGKIIGGGVVAANSVPYQCFIIINGASFCGCSIIGRSHMLTAAHCTLNARNVQLVLGAHTRNQNEATQVIMSPSGVINHPNYNNNGQLSNDVSVLRLSTQIILTQAIQIVSLASGTANYAGVAGFVSGWGRTNAGTQPAQLHGITLNIMTNAACRQVYGSVIIDSTICTNGVRNNAVAGVCSGDSGGPLVVTSGTTRIQVGVVSFAGTGCMNGNPSGYARVTSFRSWITQNAGV